MEKKIRRTLILSVTICLLPMALENFAFGCLWCVTIVGIPFGLQFFKIAKLSLAPFGARVK